MGKYEAQKYIQLELARLNEIIDHKIISGESYGKEAKRHRSLLAQVKIMQRDSHSWVNYFSRLIFN